MASLTVPRRSERRYSDGCITDARNGNVKEGRINPPLLTRQFGTALDSNLMEVLRRNYDIVSALADIENSDNQDSEDSPKSMRGRAPRTTSGSPKPLILRHHNPCNKYCYSSDGETASTLSAEESVTECQNLSRLASMGREISSFVYDVRGAFTVPRESLQESTGNEVTKLSAIALKRDLKRCFAALHPFIEMAAALYDVLMWKNPITTLLLVLVYMYSIHRGWTVSLILLLLLLQLTLNFLRFKRNVNIGLSFLPRKEVAAPRLDLSGAQLIYDIARMAQELLKFAADLLEKTHSLWTWKDERVTRVFYYLLVYWLSLSMLFSLGTCIGMCAMTFGIRLFVTTYLFDRFPLLRNRLDTFGWFYRNLTIKSKVTKETPMATENDMTNRERKLDGCSTSRRSTAIYDEKYSSMLRSKFGKDKGSCVSLTSHIMLNVGSSSSTSGAVNDAQSCSRSIQLENEFTSSTFDKDPIMDNIISSRNCYMNEKDKKFPHGYTAGILYLTNVALIFRNKSDTENNSPQMLLFQDIVSVKKMQVARSIALIAGSRKALEVSIQGRQKPIQFIGLPQRDDFLSDMVDICAIANSSVRFIC